MPRAVACSICRQDKLRCDAFVSAPHPCTRCRMRDMICTIEPSFKRTATRSRLHHLSQEIQDLKESLNRTTGTTTSSSSPDEVPKTSEPFEPASFKAVSNASKPIDRGDDQVIFWLGDVILALTEVHALFREFFHRYHPFLPMLDPLISPSELRRDCPTLLWVIITTASRSIRPDIHEALCNLIPQLLSGSFLQNSYSAHPCQALLILCMFPLPFQKAREDLRWLYNGGAMQMATLSGLHRTGSDHEYGKAGAVRVDERSQHERTRAWYCCCYMNATISTEFGLPPTFPQTAVDMRWLHKAGLPADFAAAVRIALESAKIGTMVDERISLDTSSEATAHVLGLLKMLDNDMDALGGSLRTNEGSSCKMACFALLTAKLNLYCFGLNQAIKLRTTDATQLRLSAFKAATELIGLFVGTPFVSAQAGSTTPPVQAFYPLYYWKMVTYACTVLIKLNVSKGLPELEMHHCEVTVQQVVALLEMCSMAKNNELNLLAQLLILLSRDAVHEVVKPRHEVHSRMGASLIYEMFFSAVAWKKQNEEERQKTWGQQQTRMAQPGDSNQIGGTAQTILGATLQTMDGLMANPDYFIEGLGPVGYDTNIWDTSVFDQLFAFDTTNLGFSTL